MLGACPAQVLRARRHRCRRPPRCPRATNRRSPVAVTRIDAVFDAERAINSHHADARLPVGEAEIAPLVADLGDWMRP